MTSRRIKREIGIAHSSSPTVFFAVDPNAFFGILAKQGGAVEKTPEDIDGLIRERIATNERRAFYVVVGGDLEFLDEFRRGLTMPDYVIFVGEQGDLDALGVETIDREGRRIDDIHPYLTGDVRHAGKVASRTPSPMRTERSQSPKRGLLSTVVGALAALLDRSTDPEHANWISRPSRVLRGGRGSMLRWWVGWSPRTRLSEPPLCYSFPANDGVRDGALTTRDGTLRRAPGRT